MTKVREFFSNKKVLVISIVVVSILIIFGVGYFFWLIYHKDQPAFVPEETRGSIREEIKENIAEPIASVIPAIGEPLVDSAYQNPQNNSSSATTDTSSWQTYKNEEYGFEVKYPEGWIKEIINQNKTITFWSEIAFKNKSLSVPPEITLDIIESINPDETAASWLKKQIIGDDLDSELSDVVVGDIIWIKAFQAGDPDHYLFANKVGNSIYVISTPVDAYPDIENVLSSFKTN